jgi:hypothetical protein
MESPSFGKANVKELHFSLHPSTLVSPLPSHTLFFIFKMFRRYVSESIEASLPSQGGPIGQLTLTVPSTQRSSKIGRPGFTECFQTSSLYWIKGRRCALRE